MRPGSRLATRRSVVLGGGGFLGSHLAEALVRAGVNVVATARPDAKTWKRLSEYRYECDLRSSESVAAVVDDADLLFCAQSSRRDSTYGWRQLSEVVIQREIETAEALGSALRTVDRPPAQVIQVGSLHPKGAPRGAYEQANDVCDSIVREACAARSVATCTLNFPAVYGPTAFDGVRHDSSFISQMMRSALDDQRIEVWGSGRVLRDPLFVPDAAEALVTAAVHLEDLTDGEFAVSAGDPETVGDIAVVISGAVAELTGNPVAVKHVPLPLQAEPADCHASSGTDDFEQRTSWRPRWRRGDAVLRTASALMHEWPSLDR